MVHFPTSGEELLAGLTSGCKACVNNHDLLSICRCNKEFGNLTYNTYQSVLSRHVDIQKLISMS